MPVIRIESLDDPRIAMYRDLPRSAAAEAGGCFIAEGYWLVERLLASRFETESVLADERCYERLAQIVPADIPLLLASRGMLNDIVGFRFHRGVLACGRRQPLPPFEQLLPGPYQPATLVVCVGVLDPENLGGILRSCAALGVHAVVLAGQNTDPFSRRVLRVSMGAILHTPIAICKEVEPVLRRLSDERIQVIATLLADDATPLREVACPQRVAVLLGNEGYGLPEDCLALCDQRVTIPMHRGVDSLNVSVAAGIVLHHFTAER